MQTETTSTKRPGRPPTGIDRKEQIRLAVAARRRNLEARTLQTEIPAGLHFGIKRIAERDGISMKEAVTRLLEAGYIADQAAHGRSPVNAEKHLSQTRDDMVAGLERQNELLRKFRTKVIRANN